MEAAENSTSVRQKLANIDNCMIQSVYSFEYPSSYPPTTVEALRTSCKQQTEGLRCIREKAKLTPAIIKRGLTTFVQTRQRYHKKYCTNANSNTSKKMVKDLKCIMDRKLDKYRQIDGEFANTLDELVRRNYNDSAIELKYLCCSFLKYRRVSFPPKLFLSISDDNLIVVWSSNF